MADEAEEVEQKECAHCNELFDDNEHARGGVECETCGQEYCKQCSDINCPDIEELDEDENYEDGDST